MKMSDWAKRINYHGYSIGDPSNLICIDPDDLIAIAKSSTGLSDFGEKDWQPEYYKTVEAINSSKYHTLGRLRIKTSLLLALRNRLFVTNTINENKGITKEKVDNPLIIIGLPRTGTTILFELLSQNSMFRSPFGFEAASPVSPLPNTTTGNVSRKEIGQCIFDFSMDIHEDIRLMHDHRYDLHAECQYIMGSVLCSPYPKLNLVDDKSILADKMSRDNAYLWHNKILCLLQYNQPTRKIWLLKCLSHIHNLEHVFKQYPNARIIHTHRDPCSVIPSTIKLFEPFAESMTDEKFDVEYLLNTFESGLQTSIQQRKSNLVPQSQIADIYFEELKSDPVASIQNAFDKLDIEFSIEFSKKISNYLSKNPRYKYGKYGYNIEEYGLKNEDIHERFRFYSDYYNIGF